MKSILSSFGLLLLLSTLIFACKDGEGYPPSYTIPTSYDFENVNYSGQTQRLQMFGELKAYMNSARTNGITLDANRLAGMYANDASLAQWTGTYESSKQLRDKTLSAVQADFDALLAELANASASTLPGTNGQAGRITSLDGSKTYLVGDDGLDHAQLVEKGLMGACLYYQATSVYLGPDKMNVDNETITPGEGTTMEHHWDEAFGYLGVPVDFPSNTDGLLFWGSYSNQRNDLLNSNQLLMDAFLAGRAAISNNDLIERDKAIETIRTEWERIAVGSVLHYINSGIANFDDMALRAHSLSEGIGFLYALQFNTEKSISNDQINELLVLVAGASKLDEMNLYQASTANLQIAKDKLAAYYKLEALKDSF
jgi:hypothetical protein